MKISFYGKTDVGRQRDHNEDSLLILCNVDNKWKEITDNEIDLNRSKGALFIVADGMGGANAGEVASDIAVKTVRERMMADPSLGDDPGDIQKLMHSIVMEGHNKIVKMSRQNDIMEGMGTTIVMGIIIKDTLFLIWSGDSRCYVYNKNIDKELAPFTDDHSLVWERVRNNELNPEEARLSDDSNLILQSLGGVLQKPEPEFKYIRLKNSDRIIFCSDGLNSMLSSVGIQQILDFKSSPQETCESLIQAANNAGGRDNITVIIIDVSTEGEVITETGSKVQESIKKKSRIAPFLIVLGILVVCGILFRSQIGYFFSSLFPKDVKSLVTEPPFQNDTNASGNQNSPNDSLNAGKSSANQGKMGIVPKSSNTQSKNNKMMPDSSFLETQLREAANKIISIRSNIKMVEPGGVLYNSDFYNTNKEKLDSILADLDEQEKLVRSAANLNAGNIFIKVINYNTANKIHTELLKTLEKLERSTDNIINK